MWIHHGVCPPTNTSSILSEVAAFSNRKIVGESAFPNHFIKWRSCFCNRKEGMSKHEN